jgi:hypothetical protein
VPRRSQLSAPALEWPEVSVHVALGERHHGHSAVWPVLPNARVWQ